MAETGSDVAFDVILLVIAAVGAVLWNIGIVSSVINAGMISDPGVQIFILFVFAIVLAEIYIVNTDAIKVKLNKHFSSGKGDFYENVKAQNR